MGTHPSQDHHKALGIGLLYMWGPKGKMSEVSLYCTHHRGTPVLHFLGSLYGTSVLHLLGVLIL